MVLKPGADVHVPYFAHLFKSHPYIQALQATANFIRDGQDLNFSNFCLADLPVVPLDEQKAIADYLDGNAVKVRRFIRNRRRLIEVLNEQKQAIINRGVTRGLDPNSPLKPSRIEWLGDVPDSWRLKRFKFAVRLRSGQVDPKVSPYRDYVLIAPEHLEKGTERILRQETAEQQGAISGKYLVKTGEVIYSKIRPALRKATIAPCDCLCSADMYPLMPAHTELLPDFLLLLLLSDGLTRYLVDCSMRVAMPKVNREALGDSWLCYPDINTQRRILGVISQELRPLEAIANKANKEIDLIREYRTRLIADVVTGKLDVRGLAPPLGEEPVDPEDLGEGIDDDEMLGHDEPQLVEEAADADD